MRHPVFALVASMSLLVGGSARSGQAAPVAELCLGATRHGTINDVVNHAFEGMVTVTDTAPRAGYWVVAIEGGGLDAGGEMWAQNGGGVGPNGGRVRFGVSNASQYPLTFAVLRLASANEYRDVRDAASQGRALAGRYATREVLDLMVSDLSSCVFDLDPPDPANGVPVDVPGGGAGDGCRCP